MNEKYIIIIIKINMNMNIKETYYVK